jgi:hypothetical protein
LSFLLLIRLSKGLSMLICLCEESTFCFIYIWDSFFISI